MRILITGGAGFLGSHLVDALLARGHEVVALDDVSAGAEEKILQHRDRRQFQFVRDSVLNEAVADGCINRCEAVYHLAAVVGVHHYVINPYAVLNVNVNGTQIVLRAAHKYGRKVLFTSTSEVYGRNPRVPYGEDDDRVLGSTRIDRWCYSTSKAVGEHFCFAYRKLGLQTAIVRYFNVYGPRMDKLDTGRVVTIFLGAILRNEPVKVVGDGSQTRCFTYVDDAVEGTIRAAELPAGEGDIFNIGTDRETTILALAQRMIALAGSSSTIVTVPQEQIYGKSYEDIQRRAPDVHRAERLLGWRASTSLDEGLRKTIAWFKAQQS